MITVVPIIFSLVALAALIKQDPKRARVFGQSPWQTGVGPRFLWSLCLAPGVVLPFFMPFAHWVIWLGATTAAGWFMTSLRPGFRKRLKSGLTALEIRILGK